MVIVESILLIALFALSFFFSGSETILFSLTQQQRQRIGERNAAAGASAGEFQSLGFTLFVLMAAWQVFDAADVILSGALKGGGDTKFVMWWMLVVGFVIWLPVVFVVRHFHNTMPALWSTMILYVVVICVGSLIRWRRGGWKMVKLT